MLKFILLGLFLLLIVVIRFLKPAKSSSRANYDNYHLVDSIMSDAERLFCQTLEKVVPAHCEINCKIRVADIVDIRPQSYAALNRLGYKHIDFLIVDKESKRPLLGIELDDKSHRQNKRTMERDRFVNGLYEKIGLPVFRPRAKGSYSASDLQDQIGQYLKG